MRILFIFLFFFSLLFASIESTDIQIQTSMSISDSASDGFENEFKTTVEDKAWDPLKIYNVQMTKVNDFVYIYMLGPVSKVYRYSVPEPLRIGMTNVITNLLFPARFVNNILQLKFNNAYEETNRFLLNSTFGVVGFFDIATTKAHIPVHNEDFGQTLGFYGVSNDIHIVLPILGPSNLRDALGSIPDGLLNPINYAYQESFIINDDNEFLLFQSYMIINEYSLHIDQYENIRKDAVDLYVLFKNIYEQRRNKLIKE